MSSSIILNDNTKIIKFTILDDDMIKIDVNDKYHTDLILSKEQLKIAFRFILENKEGIV